MLLAIDTSTHYASVALHDGQSLLVEDTWLANQDHTRTLLPAVQGLLEAVAKQPAHISAIGVALGPGSFNGLRVGVSTAKGLALALNVPLAGIPTLELIAAELGLEEAMMNAGAGRVYVWRLGGEIELREGTAPDRIRHAGVLARLAWDRVRAGMVDDPTHLQPLYVRPPHITESRRPAPAIARNGVPVTASAR